MSHPTLKLMAKVPGRRHQKGRYHPGTDHHSLVTGASYCSSPSACITSLRGAYHHTYRKLRLTWFLFSKPLQICTGASPGHESPLLSLQQGTGGALFLLHCLFIVGPETTHQGRSSLFFNRHDSKETLLLLFLPADHCQLLSRK